jgi:hypothetical protein
MTDALHPGYAARPEQGRTLPPLFDPAARTVTVPLDDPVGLRVADSYATALWDAGRAVEARAVTEYIHDRVSLDRLRALP